MGDDYMAAPVLNLGQRARMVYFPLGADWTHHYTVRQAHPTVQPFIGHARRAPSLFRSGSVRSLTVLSSLAFACAQGKLYKGGSTEMVPAPLNEFPLFKRTVSQ